MVFVKPYTLQTLEEGKSEKLTLQDFPGCFRKP